MAQLSPGEIISSPVAYKGARGGRGMDRTTVVCFVPRAHNSALAHVVSLHVAPPRIAPLLAPRHFPVCPLALCASAKALLEGEGGSGGTYTAAAKRLQGTAHAVRGRLLAVRNAVEAGVGECGCLWGSLRAGVWGEGGGLPPPFKRFPAP